MVLEGNFNEQKNCDLKALWVPIIVDDFILPNEMVGNNEVSDFDGFIEEIRKDNLDDTPMLFKAFDFFLLLFEEFGEKYQIKTEILIKERSRFSYFFRKNKKQSGEYLHVLKKKEKNKEVTKERIFECEVIASEKHLNLDVLTFKIKSNKSSDNEQLIIILDCYGFIFISHEHAEDFDKNLQLMSGKIISRIHKLLTNHQVSLLNRTVLNSNFDFSMFAEDREEQKNDYKIATAPIKEFINKIIVNISEYHPTLSESLSNAYIKDNYGSDCFSPEYENKISSVYLKKRTYDLSCLRKLISSSNNKWLYNASLQDRVETLSMERFLSVSTSQNYSERIIQNITSVREGLVSKIVFLTENIKISSLSIKAQKVSKAREEKIERYVEYVVSETTSFLKLNKLLRNAFYYKIGNTSYFNTVNSDETIDKLSSYNYWISVLKTLSENTSSLKTIIDLYHKKRLLSETHDLNYRKAREQDNQLVQHALGGNQEQSFSVSDSDKKFISFWGFLITGTTLFATIATIVLEPVKLVVFLFFTLLFVAYLFLSFGKRTIFSGFGDKKKWMNTPFSHINYRSKHSLVKASTKSVKDISRKLSLSHDDGDDFISNTVKIVMDLTFWSHGKEIKLIPDVLMSIGIINVTSEREHPHKRRINVSFTYIPSENDYFSRELLDSYFSEKSTSNEDLLKQYGEVVESIINRMRTIKEIVNTEVAKEPDLKYYSHFIIVYSFDLRDETGDRFYVYKNSIRASYSLRHDSKITESLSIEKKNKVQYLFNEIDVLFGRILYLAYIKPFHSEQSRENKT